MEVIIDGDNWLDHDFFCCKRVLILEETTLSTEFLFVAETNLVVERLLPSL